MGIITGSVFLFSLLMCLVLNWLSAPPHFSSPSACCECDSNCKREELHVLSL